MNEKLILSPPSLDLLKKICDGIIDENTYYSCHIEGLSSMDSEELLKNLPKGEWEDPASNPVERNVKRGISHFKDFNIEEINGEGAIFCYCDVTVDRKKESSTANTNLPETDTDIKDFPYQMSQKDLTEFLKTPTGMDNQAKKEYPAKIIKVKNFKTDPTCPECNGTGKVYCKDCFGIGEGDCPDCDGTGCFFDCEAGKQGLFHSKLTGKYLRLYYGDHCPTCKGEGHFQCETCNQTGEAICHVCKGKGEIKNKNTQKVTKLKESYSLQTIGDVYLPDNEFIHFNPILLKEELLKSKAKYNFNPNNKEPIKFQSEKKQVIEQILCEDLNKIVENKNIFSLNYLAIEIPSVRILRYKFDSEDYQIIIVGDYAFTQEIPQISFMEHLTGSFKKKIK